jgi:hypothetical protein
MAVNVNQVSSVEIVHSPNIDIGNLRNDAVRDSRIESQLLGAKIQELEGCERWCCIMRTGAL